MHKDISILLRSLLKKLLGYRIIHAGSQPANPVARSVHDDDAESKVRRVVRDATTVAKEEARRYETGREYNSAGVEERAQLRAGILSVANLTLTPYILWGSVARSTHNRLSLLQTLDTERA